MLRKIFDIFMFSAYGVFKTTLFLSFFCVSLFFVLKSKNVLHPNTKGIEPMGALVGTAERIKVLKRAKAENKNLKLDEADIFRFILKFSDKIPPADAKKLAKLIRMECDNYALDPYLILAMIHVESKFNPIAVSNKGAVGLMQVMPRTGEFVAGKLGIDMDEDYSLFDPFINVRLGIYYFSSLLDRFNGVGDALIAYNAGPTRFMNTARLRNGKSTYVRRVLYVRGLLEVERIVTEES